MLSCSRYIHHLARVRVYVKRWPSWELLELELYGAEIRYGEPRLTSRLFAWVEG